MCLDFIHEQTLVIYVVLSDSTITFSSLLAPKISSRFIEEKRSLSCSRAGTDYSAAEIRSLVLLTASFYVNAVTECLLPLSGGVL